MIMDQFNKGGNCKLQERIFNIISKFSMGISNIGGNRKIQFPQMKGGCVTIQFLQMKFVLVIPHSLSRCLNLRLQKGVWKILIPWNELVNSTGG
jgi:hypothetical protein